MDAHLMFSMHIAQRHTLLDMPIEHKHKHKTEEKEYNLCDMHGVCKHFGIVIFALTREKE